MTYSQRVQTVSELNTSIKALLETQYPFVSVTGEISNLRKPYSGHLYFTLKDKDAQLRALLFKKQQKYLSILPENGQHVICHGRISVYEPRGEYQIIVDHVEAVGDGALLQVFETLKKKLYEQGFFDQEHKKTLPLFPEKITMITSPTSAAVHDFLKVAELKGDFVPIEIFPVRVQGNEAASQISQALEILNQRNKSDIIVLCRGGGSIEDLQPFNDESLARAIFDSSIPVVSAIGHDIDYTITDFVADVRAATPTAAAEIILPDHQALKDEINTSLQRITTALQRSIDLQHHQISLLSSYLGDPQKTLEFFMLRIDTAATSLAHSIDRVANLCKEKLNYMMNRLHERNPVHEIINKKQQQAYLAAELLSEIEQIIERKKHSLHRTLTLLEAVSPQAVLGRGYAIVQKDSPASTGNSVIRSSKQTTVGDRLRVLLHKGKVFCDVTDIEE